MKSLLYIPLLLCLFVVPLHAEEQNVNPAINQHYADPNFQLWQNRFERPGREVFDKRHQIIEWLGLKKGMHVADIGAGTGLFTRLFSEQVGIQGRVYAVDVSRVFIDNILQICRQQCLDNVVGIVNTQKDVLLDPASIDLAFLSDTYHHLEFPVTTLATIHRALRPNGQLVVIDFRKEPGVSTEWVMGHVRANKTTVIKEIESAGFRLVEDADFLKINYFLRFSRI